MSPDLRSGKIDACLTRDHHLEWLCTLNAGEQRDLTVKWSVESPLNESVVYASSISGNTIIPATSNQYQQFMGSQQRVY